MFSLAFWGGIWGIVFTLVDGRFPGHSGYWLLAFLFGAILPTAAALFLVLPLKGYAMGGGGHLPLFLTAILINGAWGIGTGLILRVLTGCCCRSHQVPA